MEDAEHDLFISHASEDKKSVARPLRDALAARGWTVWLDELELTVGDSLSGRIDMALARSRFGVVVLSEAYFNKEWPKRELAGLAAREVAAGTKVILPVWHGIDEAYLLRRSPTLADRLGASTSHGIADVADEVALALERAGQRVRHRREHQPVVQPVETDEYYGLTFGRGVPTTPEEREALIAASPPCWETVLYAGYLLLGKDSLEPKWHDYELGIPRGPRRDFDSGSATLEYLDREVAWLMSQLEARVRIFHSPTKDRAFGPRGEPGNPDRIAHFAKLIIETYELLLDWFAGIRNISAPGPCADAIALAARMSEQPIQQMRDYIDLCVSQMASVPELLREHNGAGTSFEIRLFLELSADPEILDALPAAFRRAEET